MARAAVQTPHPGIYFLEEEAVKYKYQGSRYYFFLSQVLKEVPTVFQPELNSSSDATTNCKYLVQLFFLHLSLF